MATPSPRAFRRALSLTAMLFGACAPPASRPSTVVPSNAWADSTLRTLSLRQKAAQLVWPWILGDYVGAETSEWARLRRLVTEDSVGGFIVSVGSPIEIATKINALQRMSALPLLMSADLETGAGFRVRGGYFLPNAIDLGGATLFPLQMALGAAGDSSLAYEQGRVTALEARALGMHVAFGPVLDVNNNAANPVIGARSFGEDPALVARLGAEYIRGVQDHGMIATGKHFPGHGDTETNSHLALSVVSASRARLDSVELVPFQRAVRSGVGAIMTFHGFLPALDSSGVPATLSSRVMTGLLRRELGFDGLLVTDAMDMAGVVDRFGAAEASIRALEAGADVLLMPSDVRGTITAVMSAVRAGRLTEARVDSSVRRLLQLKARFGLHRTKLVELDDVRRVVADSEHVALARRIAERSIVLVRDSLNLVPLPSAARRVVSVTYARRADLGAHVAFNGELRSAYPRLRSVYMNADEATPSFTAIDAAADSADMIVIGSYVNISSTTATAETPSPLVELVRRLEGRGVRTVVVAFGSPYLLKQIPSIGSYLVAWGGSNASQIAAARAITGRAAITGRLPISIPPLVAIGAGQRRDARTTSSPDARRD
jgi:beta-N-acetylhexosaminidase